MEITTHPPMLRLLIADDIAQVRQGLRTLLPLAAAQAGLAVEIAGEASSGAEAILLADLLHPDAILMDLEMPGVDGWTAARTIHERFPGMRIVALTIHNGEDTRQLALHSGFSAFLVKGASASQVLAALCDRS